MDAPGERNSKEWLLGPRGAELEPWDEAAANLPGAATSLAALLCVPQTAPTVWVRDDMIDELELWDVLQQLVNQYDAGNLEPDVWVAVLGGQGHLAVLGDGG